MRYTDLNPMMDRHMDASFASNCYSQVRRFAQASGSNFMPLTYAMDRRLYSVFGDETFNPFTDTNFAVMRFLERSRSLLSAIVFTYNILSVRYEQSSSMIHFAYGHDGRSSGVYERFSHRRILLLSNHRLAHALNYFTVDNYMGFINFIGDRRRQTSVISTPAHVSSRGPTNTQERRGPIRINTALEQEYVRRVGDGSNVADLTALIAGSNLDGHTINAIFELVQNFNLTRRST